MLFLLADLKKMCYGKVFFLDKIKKKNCSWMNFDGQSLLSEGNEHSSCCRKSPGHSLIVISI